MSYIKYKDGMVYQTTEDVEGVQTVLTPGFYKPSYDQNRVVKFETVAPKELHKPIMLKPLKDTMNYIEEFCKDEVKQKINSMGYLHKAGIFLFGKSGTMKTTFSWFVADRLVKTKDAIVLDTGVLECMLNGVKDVRKKQDNLIVVLIDEVDLYVEMEASLKRFLDGPDSIDNLIVIATTNKNEVFHESFFRPSRFAIQAKVPGIDDVDFIKKILTKNKIQHTPEDLQELKGCSMDEIKDFMRNKVLNIKPASNHVRQMGFKRYDEQEDPENISGKEIYNIPKAHIFEGFFADE